MNPKVSIIVPVYRVEKFLERCFKSLKEQTLKDIEIILVDDESPDRCPQMCDEFAKIDSRVRVIHKKIVDWVMLAILGWKWRRGNILHL